MKRMILILMVVVFLFPGCAARRQRKAMWLQQQNERVEMRLDAERSREVYLLCLESAAKLADCEVQKEIYNEKLGLFLYHKEMEQRELDRTITVKEPWWQILLKRGRRR